MKFLKALSLLGALSYTQAAGKKANYDYSVNGKNWKDKFPDCGTPNQSPIDLSTKPDAPYKKVSSNDDRLIKEYSNQYEDVAINWNGASTVITLEDGPNQFSSTLAQDIFGTTKQWEGLQFHFHAGSEHTIDGKRLDLELHIVHSPPASTKKNVEMNGFAHAAVGLIFDVDDHNANLSNAQVKLIDTFFDTL